MAILDITSSTTVGNFNETITALEKAKKNSTKPAEQERFNELINKYTTSKNKLINICKNDIIKGNMFANDETRVQVGKLTRDNYKALSLEAWNKLLDAEHQHKVNELKAKDPAQLLIDFLDGKSGINLMTGVKTTLTTAAVASLFYLNLGGNPVTIVSIIPKIITTLAGVNPVLGVAAGALLGLGVIKLTKKIFGPEIKKLWTNIKVRNKVNKEIKTAQEEVSSEEDIDKILGESPEKYQKNAEKKIEDKRKRNDGTYKKEFLDAALDISLKTYSDDDKGKKEKEDAINDLKNKYKDSLEPAEIDELLKKAGLADEQPSLGDTAKELKDDGFTTHKKKDEDRSAEGEAFYKFRKAYTDLIQQIGDSSIAPSVKAQSIRKLREDVKTKFNPEATGLSAKQKTIMKKLQTLCNGMADIAEEFFKQITKDASKAATNDALKNLQAQLEGDRGLAADQIKNL